MSEEIEPLEIIGHMDWVDYRWESNAKGWTFKVFDMLDPSPDGSPLYAEKGDDVLDRNEAELKHEECQRRFLPIYIRMHNQKVAKR